MTVRTSIALTQVDAKSPVNETLMTSLRNNDLNHEERLLVQEANSTNWSSQLGRALTDTHMGTFTGTFLPDNSTVKACLQTIETPLAQYSASIADGSSATTTISATYPSYSTSAASVDAATGTGKLVLRYLIEFRLPSGQSTTDYGFRVYSIGGNLLGPVTFGSTGTSYVNVPWRDPSFIYGATASPTQGIITHIELYLTPSSGTKTYYIDFYKLSAGDSNATVYVRKVMAFTVK